MVATWLRQEWNIPAAPCPVIPNACDGKSALENSFGDAQLKPSQRHFDLISAIRGAVRASTMVWKYRHVQGHSDRRAHYANLSWWERMNIEADELAGVYRRRLVRAGSPSPPNARFFSEAISVFIHGIKQQLLDREAISELIALPHLKARWREKNTIVPTVKAEVDWEMVRRGMKGLPCNVQRWAKTHSGHVWGRQVSEGMGVVSDCGMPVLWTQQQNGTACSQLP